MPRSLPNVQILSKEYAVEKSRLKVWLQLEGVQRRLIGAIENKDRENVASLLCLYVSIALDIPVTNIEDAPWQEIATAYSLIVIENRIELNLPIFRSKPQTFESVLDYVGREWYEWAHMFAREYGWKLEYIANLEVEEAMGLMQEISADKQYVREWQWALSPNSIGYDSATKKSKHIELPRPSWMIEEPKGNQPIKTRIPKSLLPVGNVISWGGERSNVKH